MTPPTVKQIKTLLSELADGRPLCDPTMDDPPCPSCEAIFQKLYTLLAAVPVEPSGRSHELALEGAKRRHDQYFNAHNANGHVFKSAAGTIDGGWGFSTCPHPDCVLVRAAVPVEEAAPLKEWEGDLPTEHPNRCKLHDRLLWADIFNEDGSHRAMWRCHKREGHDGPCSTHNDCGVMNGGVVCGLLPGHTGPHAWETRITVAASPGPVAGAVPTRCRCGVQANISHYCVALGHYWIAARSEQNETLNAGVIEAIDQYNSRDKGGR